uniref:Uncharacterized protein n=2 Tax=Physcomitrium patens TaxID=3218 RepID=A0A2K1JNZ0_PHYPA|nr:hypothetical protein PHYPA_015650 [Physcomitrium patens]
MMKDYKSVHEWQHVCGGGAKDSFKVMSNKDRKNASSPQEMYEIIVYSLHAIQNGKQEKKDSVRYQKSEYKASVSSLISSTITKGKVGSSEGNDMGSTDTYFMEEERGDAARTAAEKRELLEYYSS